MSCQHSFVRKKLKAESTLELVCVIMLSKCMFSSARNTTGTLETLHLITSEKPFTLDHDSSTMRLCHHIGAMLVRIYTSCQNMLGQTRKKEEIFGAEGTLKHLISTYGCMDFDMFIQLVFMFEIFGAEHTVIRRFKMYSLVSHKVAFFHVTPVAEFAHKLLFILDFTPPFLSPLCVWQ